MSEPGRFGDALGSLRIARGLSRADLGRLADCSESYVALLEQGVRRPKAGLTDQLIAALQLDATDTTRLRVALALDRFADGGVELPPGGAAMIEQVIDAVLLVPSDGRSQAIPADLPREVDGELRKLASAQIIRLFEATRHRWDGSKFLPMRDYFDQIVATMAKIEASPSSVGPEVRAINTIDPRRWTDDKREINYNDTNAGAVARGVRIRRIFVVDEAHSDESVVQAGTVQDPKIEVRYLDRREVAQLLDQPEDVVRFHGNAANGEILDELYIGHCDVDDPTRVEFGERVQDTVELARFDQVFRLLWEIGTDDSAAFVAARAARCVP